MQPIIRISVETVGLPRLRDKLGRFAKGDAKKELLRQSADLANKSLNVARSEAPKKSGYLASQIELSGGFASMTGNQTSWSITDNAWYAPFVKKGTKPHWVIAGLQEAPAWVTIQFGRNQSNSLGGGDRGWPKKYLSWEGSTGYIPYVYQNKGITANPYDQRAYERILSLVSQMEQKYLDFINVYLVGTNPYTG